MKQLSVSRHFGIIGDPLPLEVIRRFLGVILFWQAIELAVHAEQWFGRAGWVTDATAHSVSPVLRWLGGIGISGAYLYGPLLTLLGLAGLGMAFGQLPWLSTLLAFLALQYVYARCPLILNGADRTVRILVFLLCFYTGGKYVRGAMRPLWPQRLIAWQVCIVYLSTVAHKVAYEESWTAGFAVRLISHWPQYRWIEPPKWLLSTSLPEVLTYLTLAIELLLGLLMVLPARVRHIVLLAGVLLHIGISSITMIPYFGPVMVISYASFLSAEELRRLKSWSAAHLRRRNAAGVAAGVILLALSGCSPPVVPTRLRSEIVAVAGIGDIVQLRTLLAKRTKVKTEGAELYHEQAATQAAGAAGAWLALKLLIENGYRFDGVDSSGNALIHHAANRDASDWIKWLVSNGSVVDLRNGKGSTPLHLAAYAGSVGAIRELLANRAAIDARNHYEETPLHVAVWMGQKAVVELLLSRGAKADVKAKGGETPLAYAVARKYPEIGRVLRRRHQL